MANRDIFFKASFIEPPQICGRQLRPFSLCHEYFLSSLGNPYLVGGQPSDNDLLTAILVCSKTYQQCRRFLYKPTNFLTALWVLRWKRHGLEIAHESFEQYKSDYFDVPEHTHKNEGVPDKYKAPWQYHCVRILCAIYNYTTDEAWNLPINLARCYADAWAESRGDDSLIASLTPEEAVENENKLWQLVVNQREELKAKAQ